MHLPLPVSSSTDFVTTDNRRSARDGKQRFRLLDKGCDMGFTLAT